MDAIEPVPEHLDAVAIKRASGETSERQIAQDLELSVEYVRLIISHPGFDKRVQEVAVSTKPASRSIEARLENEAHDAIDVLHYKMHHGINERNQILAASKLLDGRNAGKAATRGVDRGFQFILPPGEAQRIIETRIQIRIQASGNGGGGEDGAREDGAPSGLSGELVLPDPGSPRVQGPGSTRTSPCLSIPYTVVDPTQAS